MKNIINSFLRIKPTNRIIIVMGFFLLIIVAVISSISEKPTVPSSIPEDFRQPSISPVISGQPGTVFQTPTPALDQPFPTPKLSINVKLTEPVEKIDKVNEYVNIASLSDTETQNNLPKKLGFITSDKLANNNDNLLIWTTSTKTLVVKVPENSIIFTNNQTPSATGQFSTTTESYAIGRQLINELFGSQVESSLLNQNITYYKTSRIYASPSTPENADLIRVSFYQSIENFPVVSLSETGAVFTLYIDRNYNLHSMTVSGGFRVLSQINEQNLISFTDASKMVDQALRINSSPDLGSNFETASSNYLILTTSKAQIAYMLINNIYSPVYLLSGTVTGNTAPSQTGLYVIPAAKN